jgi:hypothetical protein
MNKRSFFLTACLAFMAYSTVVISSPASTDYVNSRIKEAVDSVLVQLAQQTQKIESKINVIPIMTLHQIGEMYQGGIIFWVDDTRQHGLIVAKIDAYQGQGIQWQNGESGEKTTNARSDGLYAGVSNTHLIVSQQTIDDQEGNFAALSARNFAVLSDGISPCTLDASCYGNWYLPSLHELQLIRANLYTKGIGDFSEGLYWTSTEVTVNQAFTVNWITGESTRTDKASTEPNVRPIHSF